MFACFKYIDSKVVSIGVGGLCLVIAGATAGVTSAAVVSPIFSLLGFGAFGYYALKVSLDSIEKSKEIYDGLLKQKTAEGMKLYYGDEASHAKACDTVVKVSTITSTFVNVLRVSLPDNDGVKMAANTVVPLTLSTTFCALTFFQNRSSKMNQVLANQNLGDGASLSRRSNISISDAKQDEKSFSVSVHDKSSSITASASALHKHVHSLQFHLSPPLPPQAARTPNSNS